MAQPINPARGEKCHNAKLTKADIKLLFDCVAERERLRREAAELSNRRLAEKFNVHQRTIEKALRRETWFHI